MTKALLHELGKSLSYGRLSLRAKVLWPMLLASSDDQGRGIAEYDAIKWYVCPNVPEIEVDDIAVLLGEMEQQGMIAVYGTARGLVYQVVRWWEYQDLQWARPSKYDAPDGWTDRLRYSNRGAYFVENWDTSGGFDANSEQEPIPEEPVNQVENQVVNQVENQVAFQPNLTQLNSTQPNSIENFTPSSGEKLPIESDSVDGDSSIEWSTPQEGQKQTKTERLQALRQAAGGADPVEAVFNGATRAPGVVWSVPPTAGGADPWERVADAFCCLQGIRLSDMPPKKQSQWARKLQSIGEEAQATPAQVIAAIRILPDTELAFKVPGYTTPYKQSFGDDIAMVIAKMATGQDLRGETYAAHNRGNWREPIREGADDIETIQRKLAAIIAERG